MLAFSGVQAQGARTMWPAIFFFAASFVLAPHAPWALVVTIPAAMFFLLLIE
jgi:hypothetical protein